jgi:hypothetical protein
VRRRLLRRARRRATRRSTSTTKPSRCSCSSTRLPRRPGPRRPDQLGRDQWGMINETGNYPGQPWMWLSTFWYQIKPFATSDNADALVWPLMALLTLALILLPFIPGLRSPPRYLGVHLLTWRNPDPGARTVRTVSRRPVPMTKAQRLPDPKRQRTLGPWGSGRSAVQAACWYSLISPPRICVRRIRPVTAPDAAEVRTTTDVTRKIDGDEISPRPRHFSCSPCDHPGGRPPPSG